MLKYFAVSDTKKSVNCQTSSLSARSTWGKKILLLLYGTVVKVENMLAFALSNNRHNSQKYNTFLYVFVLGNVK